MQTNAEISKEHDLFSREKSLTKQRFSFEANTKRAPSFPVLGCALYITLIGVRKPLQLIHFHNLRVEYGNGFRFRKDYECLMLKKYFKVVTEKTFSWHQSHRIYGGAIRATQHFVVRIIPTYGLYYKLRTTGLEKRVPPAIGVSVDTGTRLSW
jgi:hypothetical protein